MGPKNYIEREPRMYTPGQPLVIEAIKIGTKLKVLAPIGFLLLRDTVQADGWKEVDHEAGAISEDEWKLLVAGSAL